jgi:DNA (cytosine-5)-methyltransferase 1
MKYLSVCSGIEAATQAWHHLGWEPVAFAEIEKFPSAVLAHHYPDVPNLGDMTQYRSWDRERFADLDVLVGGTPCQSFSVAGLRKGMDDPRGNLALVFLGIADRFRPRWVAWENVPGVMSSNKGRDFGAFLGALGELGYGWSYRVLDAQYVRVESHPWAVPQRRRRVFVVGYLGDWRRAAAVLFDPESLSGRPPPRREGREEVAGSVAPSLTGDGRGMNTTLDEGQTLTRQCFTYSAEVGPTMGASGPPYSRTGNARVESEALVAHGMAVRRLTPRECERLQGFPDDFTAIPWRGKPASLCPDGPRYRALGNSMAVNVMRWLGDRISAVGAL